MSSGSESDEDYVPKEPEKVSEESSADEETESQYEKELEHKTKKRKIVEESSKGKKKRKPRNYVEETMSEKVKEDIPEKSANPEEEKKRVDDLWAKFLEGTETKPRSAPKETNNAQPKASVANSIKDNETKSFTKTESEKDRERRIFEFAGEKIIVENNVIKEKIKSTETPTVSNLGGPSSRIRGSGGLANVLGQLNKKNELTTLEKSKLDWDTYKKEEGIEEEVQNHNKGKSGYLDRRDFLERADLRQYEIERDLRMTRRSNR